MDRKEYMRNWRKANPSYIREKTNSSYAKLRQKVIAGYGGKCVVCGFSDWRALQIDHVHGGGCKELREVWKGSVRGFLYWLVKQNFPPEYQCLCANHNQIKRHERGEF
jgi:hypothetical protein